MFEKIKSLYPTLTDADFYPNSGTILLQDDGAGPYIKEWNHPTLTKPTTEQLS